LEIIGVKLVASEAERWDVNFRARFNESCMRALSESEITRIIQEGKKLSEEEGTAVLDQFEQGQPEIYQAIELRSNRR